MTSEIDPKRSENRCPAPPSTKALKCCHESLKKRCSAESQTLDFEQPSHGFARFSRGRVLRRLCETSPEPHRKIIEKPPKNDPRPPSKTGSSKRYPKNRLTSQKRSKSDPHWAPCGPHFCAFFRVLAPTASESGNGGVPADYGYGNALTLMLAPSTLQLHCGGALIDQVAYSPLDWPVRRGEPVAEPLSWGRGGKRLRVFLVPGSDALW